MALTEILQVAYDILSNAKEPLHVSVIAEKAIADNKNMGMTHDDFVKKLNSSLAQNVKLTTTKPSFAKAINPKTGKDRKGVYRHRVLKASPSIPPQPQPTTDTLFIGRAGEYAVMSELLFLGFNVSLMSVDQGIDIIASKNNQYFHIQVKTTSIDLNGQYVFTTKSKSFTATNSISTFYVFVMRGKLSNEYSVIPSGYLHTLINRGVIAGVESFSIRILKDKNKQYLLNKKDDISWSINNFGQLKTIGGNAING